MLHRGVCRHTILSFGSLPCLLVRLAACLSGRTRVDVMQLSWREEEEGGGGWANVPFAWGVLETCATAASIEHTAATHRGDSELQYY